MIISGSLVDRGDELIPLFTLFIRLNTATDIRIERLKRREYEHFGSRIEIGGDMFEDHQKFLAWAAAYNCGDINMRGKAKHDDFYFAGKKKAFRTAGNSDKQEVHKMPWADFYIIFVKTAKVRLKSPYSEEALSMTDEEKQQITRLRKKGCGYTAVANKVGISKDTVKSFCRRNGLAGKRASQDNDAAGCRECGRPLQQRPGMKPRVFCCDECRVKWWHEHPEKIKQRAVYSFTCAGCGKPFTAYGNSKRKYCSHECYVRNRFRGGDGSE